MLPELMRSLSIKKKDLQQNKKETASQKIKNFVMKKPLIFVAVSVILLLLLSTQFRAAFIVMALVAAAAVSKLTQAIIPFVIVIDLIVFALIVLTFTYGAVPAIILTLIAFYVGTILRSGITGHVAAETYVLPPVGYILTAILLTFVKPLGIVVGGMIGVGFYAALMMFFYWQVYKSFLDELTFLATIIPFNYWLLAKFGEKMLALLGG